VQRKAGVRTVYVKIGSLEALEILEDLTFPAGTVMFAAPGCLKIRNPRVEGDAMVCDVKIDWARVGVLRNVRDG
jgi:hypothetical protein